MHVVELIKGTQINNIFPNNFGTREKERNLIEIVESEKIKFSEKKSACKIQKKKKENLTKGFP